MRSSRAYSPLTVLLLSLLCSTPTAATAQASPTLSVTIALIDDYPAFTPASLRDGSRRYVDLRAIIARPDGYRGTPALILLHPDHVTPETLGSAILMLQGRTRREDAGPLTALLITTTQRLRPIPPPMLQRLEATLAELREQPLTHVHLTGAGRQVTIPDIHQYR